MHLFQVKVQACAGFGGFVFYRVERCVYSAQSLKEGQETHTALASLNWVLGKHELKFGPELRVHRITFAQPGWPAGQFRFDATGTSEFLTPDADTGGDGMASFLIGVGRMNTPQPNACNCPYEVPNNVATQNFQFGAFVQDNFRVTPKLTLNLGLRYEVSLPRTERFNRMNWLDPNLAFSLQADQALIPGAQPLQVKGGEVFASPNDRYNYDTYYRAIQPRFGFGSCLIQQLCAVAMVFTSPSHALEPPVPVPEVIKGSISRLSGSRGSTI